LDTTSRERPSGETIDSLEREADLARAAIGLKFQEVKASLQNAADPRQWAREHPWVAVSVAAAAGLATALAIAAPRPKARRPRAERERFDDDDRSAPRPSGIGSTIVGMLFELAKIFMTTHLIPLFQAWQQGLAEQAAQAAGPPRPGDAPRATGTTVGEGGIPP
jgi:hypothetical protein